MSSLTGNLISTSYSGLLKTVDNGTITNSLKNITDGVGNATSLYLSSNIAEITGSLQVTGSISVDSPLDSAIATLTAENLTVGNSAGTIGVYTDMHGIEFFSGSNSLDITVDGTDFNDYVAGTLIAVRNNLGNPAVVVQFQNHNNWTNGNMDINVPMTFHSGSTISGSVNITGSLRFATSSSFVLPVVAPAAPVIGTAYFSGSYLYIYNGSAYKSASLF
jgi:hypothetical protein